MRHIKRGILPVLLTLVLVGAACGGEEDAAPDPAELAMDAARFATEDAAQALEQTIAIGNIAESAAEEAAAGITRALAAESAAQAALDAAQEAGATAEQARAAASANATALAGSEVALRESRAAAQEALAEAKLARAEVYEARTAAPPVQPQVSQAETTELPPPIDAPQTIEPAIEPAEVPVAESMAPGSVPLTVLVVDQPDLPARFWDMAISATLATHPQFAVSTSVVPHHQAEETLRRLAANRQLPDVIISNTLIPELIDGGLLLPFEPADLERFIDPVGLGMTNGRQYTLPALTVLESAVFYNKAIFEIAEIASEPASREDLAAAAEAVAAIGIAPFVVGGAGPFLAGGSGDDRWAAAWMVMSMTSLNVTGVDPAFNARLRAGDVGFTDPAVIQTLRQFESLVRLGWLPEDALSLGYTDLQQRFLDGRAAMYPMGAFFVESIPENLPFEIGVFPMPSVDGSKRLATYTKNGPAISAATANPEQARLFAVEMTMNLDLVLPALLGRGSVPSTRSLSMPPDIQLDPLMMKIVDIVADPTAQHVPLFTFEEGDSRLLPGFQEELFMQVEEMLAGKSADEAARSLQEAWNRLSG